MDLTFFGGAAGIGASCVLVATPGLRVVVDCGIRQGRGDTLPDLGGLQAALQGAAPDAIVLTHAHLDHSGALPLLVQAWPGVRVLCTEPTADLVGILLRDAVKIMGLDRDQEIPLYGKPQVGATLAALKPSPLDDAIPVGSGSIRLLPAGHIMGAAAVFIEDGRRSVLISGDISITSQSSIPGMPRPRCQPEAVVIESTYGDRMHSSREAEERRLCDQVGSAIERGGHVLVPAFAVGRSQEVLLTLLAAMRGGRIPRFPVYADGMVRAVCAAYARHPAYLSAGLRRLVHRERDPFFPEDPPFERVRDNDHRQRIIEGPPCCVVASSGMLAGGASPLYARAWAGEPASLIAVTGYQDEEAPGRALLELADGQVRTLRLPGGSVEVRCAVERYHLSAHADADQIAGLLASLRPRSAWIVHGDTGARRGLANRLAEVLKARVELPEEGRCYHLAGSGRRPTARWQGPGLGAGRPLTSAGLRAVADLMLGGKPASPRIVRVEEIAQAWHGEHFAAEDVHRVRRLLQDGCAAFAPDPKRPYRYQPVPTEAPDSGPATQPRVLAAIDQALPATTGLVKRSLHVADHRVVLSFALPDAQAPRVQPVIERLAAQTGWRFEVHPHPRQDALAEAFHQDLPPECQVVKGPAFVQDLRLVRARVSPLPDDCGSMAQRFQDATGWVLQLEGAPESPTQSAAHPAFTSLGCASVLEPLRSDAEPRSPQDCRRLVLAAFADLPSHLRPAKVGYPHDGLRLHLVHPGMIALIADRTQALASATGRRVIVHPHPMHQLLMPLILQRVPEDWVTTRKPSWVGQEDHARVTVFSLPSQGEIEAFQQLIQVELGCVVVVVTGE